jgi:hypothetical protein
MESNSAGRCNEGAGGVFISRALPGVAGVEGDEPAAAAAFAAAAANRVAAEGIFLIST